MASTNTIGILISAKDEASKTLSQVSSEIKSTGNSSDEASPKAGRFSSGLASVADMVKAAAVSFATYKIGQTIAEFASTSVSAAAELEQTNMAFQSLTGNAQLANSVFAQLVQYANVTPFESKDIEKAAQTLMSFGTEGQQTVDIIKQLGDVTSVGGGDLQALSLVTGQVFAQGKMRAQDMYQVINDGGAGLIKVMADNAGGMQKLTDEFNNGGIPAKQYFDAIAKATKNGGFAFEGANKQADTFNGRLSTLKDSATQFGEKLIGVKIDPVLGLQVQPGGLFDRMKGMMSGLTDDFAKWGAAAGDVIPKMMDWFDKTGRSVMGVYKAVDNYLGPKISELWKSFKDNIIPILSDLWHNILEPLIPVIGKDFVGAIGLAIDIAKKLFDGLGWLYQQFKEGNPIIIGLAGVFGTLAAAMAFNAIFNALSVGFATLTLVTIPSVMTSVGALAGLIAAPIVMPAIAVGAALAAIALVWDAYNKMMNAVNGAADAKSKQLSDESSMINHFVGVYKDPKSSADAKAGAKRWLHADGIGGYALGTSFAPGGLAMVGEHGPELVSLPRGASVASNSETRKMVGQGGGTQIIINGGMNISNQMDEQKFLANLGWRLSLR